MGVPVAWIIMSRSCAHDITYWMHILLQRAHLKNINWKLNAFMVDDAAAEIKAIRYIFLIIYPFLIFKNISMPPVI